MMVLVTGAAGGLGRAMAMECADRGFSLCLTDINEARLRDIRRGIEHRYATEVHAKACDLKSAGSTAALFDYMDTFGIVPDMVLNIAGIDFEGGFSVVDGERIDDIVQLNIAATLRVTHSALKRRRGHGRFYIVNVSSLASIAPIPLKATYAASKRFIYDFSVALGEELKPDNVNVLVLCPGGLATNKEAISGIAAQGFWGNATTNDLERVARRTISRVLAGRRIYIPGAINAMLRLIGRFVPVTWTAHLLHRRWHTAQAKWLNRA